MRRFELRVAIAALGASATAISVSRVLLGDAADFHVGALAYADAATTSPVITSNWLAPSGQQWTVPIGGGFGRVFRIGDQPVNASIAGYYNAIRPTGTPAWQLRAELALLFPVK